jgi:MOSC domain-containing protein YiiM
LEAELKMIEEKNKYLGKNGRIFQINRSKGGVPKIVIEECELGELGLEGDSQNNVDIHGGPERALCLYSLEKIIKLQIEGHSVFPGALGENLTISGISWDSIEPGVRLKVSNGVKIQVTSFTSPCRTIESYFADNETGRISQKMYPGWSRVYARVLKGGTVKIGDSIHFENDH